MPSMHSATKRSLLVPKSFIESLPGFEARASLTLRARADDRYRARRAADDLRTDAGETAGGGAAAGRADQQLLDVVHVGEVDQRGRRPFRFEHMKGDALLR